MLLLLLSPLPPLPESSCSIVVTAVAVTVVAVTVVIVVVVVAVAVEVVVVDVVVGHLSQLPTNAVSTEQLQLAHAAQLPSTPQ
jgi:hypothetical protein